MLRAEEGTLFGLQHRAAAPARAQEEAAEAKAAERFAWAAFFTASPGTHGTHKPGSLQFAAADPEGKRAMDKTVDAGKVNTRKLDIRQVDTRRHTQLRNLHAANR